MAAIEPVTGSRWIAYFQAMSIEAFELLAGLKPVAELAAVQREYADLFDRAAVSNEEAALLTAPATERPLASLRLQLRAHSYIEREVATVSDEIATATAPLSGTVPAMRRATGRAERIALGDEWVSALAGILPLYEDLWAKRWIAAESLGAGYASCYLRWKELPSAGFLERLSRDTLAATEREYEESLDEFAHRVVGVGREDLVWQDIPALMAGRVWDHCFPAERLLPTLHAVAEMFGVRLGLGTEFTLDTEERPTKTSRPFCVGCRIPGDIRLVIRPSGGQRDYEEALHELGHLFHLGAVDADLAWEYRYVFRDAVFEAYAYQIASLLRNPDFIVDVIGLAPNDARDYVRYASFLELYMIRRYCGKVLFELRYHQSGTTSAPRTIYVEELENALRFTPPAGQELTELDSGLYAVEYLLAWFNAARLTARCTRASGDGAWYRSNTALAELRALWRRGSAAAFSAPFLSSPDPAAKDWLTELVEQHQIALKEEEYG